MKHILLLLSLFLLSLSLVGQSAADTGTVSGKVVEAASQQAVAYVTVALKDSSGQLFAGTITDEAGTFLLEKVPAGTYRLQLQLIGYQSLEQEVQLSQGFSSLRLGTLFLQEDVKQLEEVVVEGEQPGFALKLDKKVYFVEGNSLAQSGSAHEVLDQLPSVSVSPDGSISLRGNAGVHVLINGRRSGLTLNGALDQIPADAIEKVEVITNPSARYDASGAAGIINLVLKKNRAGGFTGQMRLVGGIPHDFRANGSLNYKRGKLNLFSTLGFRYTDYVGYYRTKQTTHVEGHEQQLLMEQSEDRHDDGKLLYLGADYSFNERNSVTAAFFRNATEDTDETVLDYRYGMLAAPDSLLLRSGNSEEARNYNQLEFNYTKLFREEGRKLTFDLQYDFWNSRKNWDLKTMTTFPEEENGTQLRTISDGSSNDLVVQSDYRQALGKSGTLEAGLKGESRWVSSDYQAELLAENEWQVLKGLDNLLNYHEKIAAAYLQYGGEMGKWGYLLGLRNEFTRISISDQESEFGDRKQYNKLFPTASLRYTFREETSLQASYSKRIGRPSLWYIYPFNELTDLNSQFVGNPELDPSYTDALELNLLQHWKKLSFTPSLYYQHSKDFIHFYVYRNAEGVFISTPVNLEQEQRYGLELTTSYDPLSWLRLSGELNVYGFRQQGELNGQRFSLSEKAWASSVQGRVQLPHQIRFQGSFVYLGAKHNAQTLEKARSSLELGVSKELFGERASLLFDVSNVLNSRQEVSITQTEAYYLEQLSNRTGTRFRLSFVYRFNKHGENKVRRQQSGNRN